MRLAYFDENKYSSDNPFFFIGGIIIPEESVRDLEKTLSQIQYNFFGTSILNRDTEFHGKELFHGKGVFKKTKISDRIKVFDDIGNFITRNEIPIRLVCIDVGKHRGKYYYPEPEYRLGLMLYLERLCDYLDKYDDMGIVFGDYEADEITRSVLDFSQFKADGKTLYKGRTLGRLIDTVYFTHSHHSRFLQVADMIIFMAGRFNNMNKAKTWHDEKVKLIWEKIKANTDIRIQYWP